MEERIDGNHKEGPRVASRRGTGSTLDLELDSRDPRSDQTRVQRAQIGPRAAVEELDLSSEVEISHNVSSC